MHKDLLYAAGRKVVKDRKRDHYAFHKMSYVTVNLRFHAVIRIDNPVREYYRNIPLAVHQHASPLKH